MKEQTPSLSKNTTGRTTLSSSQLMQEAKRQSEALKMIGRWRALGMAAAILCDMGIRNGRRKVEKILDAAQGGSSQRAHKDA